MLSCESTIIISLLIQHLLFYITHLISLSKIEVVVITPQLASDFGMLDDLVFQFTIDCRLRHHDHHEFNLFMQVHFR